MKIMHEDVRQIAKLAALYLSETQITATTDALGNILKLLNQLEAFPVDDAIAPLEYPFPGDSSHALRPDKAFAVDNTEQVRLLAPHTEDGVYLVPSVIE